MVVVVAAEVVFHATVRVRKHIGVRFVVAGAYHTNYQSDKTVLQTTAKL
jgi:hypothetical protein